MEDCIGHVFSVPAWEGQGGKKVLGEKVSDLNFFWYKVGVVGLAVNGGGDKGTKKKGELLFFKIIIINIMTVKILHLNRNR